MKPIIKVHQISISITVLLLLSIWTLIYSLKSVSDSAVWVKCISVLIACFSSVGIYKLIILTLTGLLQKCNCIKKWIFGNSYMEGTWVGFYIGNSGEVRYIIENYEQDLEGLTIRGKSYDENYKYHTNWTSSSSNIDVEKGRVSYMYETYSIKDRNNNNGIAFFNFERDNKTSPPKSIIGFSSDLFLAGRRLPAMEYKLDTKCTSKQGLEYAVRYYEENKENIFVDITN